MPRIRFTVGTLVFSVAVVAVNCWVWRRITELPSYENGWTSYRPLPAVVGVFRLFTLKIEPDGRFAWSAGGCTWTAREYGYVKRHGGQIELAPIPHLGKEIHPAMFQKFREIPWGERLYVSIADERWLWEFCRQGLTPKRLSNPRFQDQHDLRRSDGDKPQTGLPQLPAEVWLGFLANEMDLNNEEGCLWLALDSLLARIGRLRPGIGHRETIPTSKLL